MHPHLKLDKEDNNKKAMEEFCKYNPEFNGTVFYFKTKKINNKPATNLYI